MELSEAELGEARLSGYRARGAFLGRCRSNHADQILVIEIMWRQS